MSNDASILPITSRLLTVVLLLAVTACGSDERRTNGVASVDPEASFASYSQELYRELDETPLSDSMQIDIGMFGDLNVMAGENVVMGRYRYRVDRIGGDVSGHLTFFARSSEDGGAVPVVLVFDNENGSWKLSDATYVPAAVEGGTTFSVEEVLDRRLDAWASRAASNVTTPTP